MSNRLAAATSPYLQQHAENPVEWFEWGEDAFAQARAENKPIFLSIGYSTCHWCHVMAHESFEDADIARQLNAGFVCIKVDREERPDVDRIYMTYVQAVTGHGGWPLSAWLTPELKPFFGGTYFPPSDRAGRPGFPTVLKSIAEGWAKDRDRVVAESDRVVASLAEHHQEEPVGEAEPDFTEPAGAAFEQAYTYLFENYDAQEGGFGGAPKFPRPANLDFLFRCAVLQGVETETGREAVGMAAKTLERMAMGGIHDHVGGGFHRYAVDDGWLVPHFEKMLYDQAQLAGSLLDAYSFTGDDRFGWVARGVLDYVLRDLAHPNGGFYAAEDADSAGEDGRRLEGAFYLWTRDEIDARLGRDAGWFSAHYGVTQEGNVPSQLDPHGDMAGRCVLKQRAPLARTAVAHAREPAELVGPLAGALQALFDAREKRARPHRDEKIVTAWNGLMISALARAAASEAPALAELRETYLQAARRAAGFIREHLWDANHRRLHRAWRGGRRTEAGFAEDHAGLVMGLLDLYEATWETAWLDWAIELQEAMDTLFWDDQAGGYFQAAEGDNSIVLRLKDDYDGAEPTANSLAATNLLRMGTLLHDESLRRRGLLVLQAFRGRWSKQPWGLPAMLLGLEWALTAARQIVILGNAADPEFTRMIEVARCRTGRRTAVIGIRHDDDLAWWARRVPTMREFKIGHGSPTAQLCEGFVCQRPVSTAVQLEQLLHEIHASGR